MFFQNLKFLSIALIILLNTASCIEESQPDLENEPTGVLGFNLLSEVSGHWVGKNETAFGDYDWFAFDFRPISSSHIHSIYEGGTAQNIISSFFVAKYDGKNQIMARNGGWLGSQYRATYFLLDKAEESQDKKYYRLVDAKGGIKRSYMELTFENGGIKFEAFKDNSGALDDPKLHMSFTGTNYNPEFAAEATQVNMFPKNEIEIDMENQFDELIDNDSALFLEESLDPFPRADHSYLSELKINIQRNENLKNEILMLYLSSEPLVSDDGKVDLQNVDKKVLRTIEINRDEEEYTATYLHPDDYYVTVFLDSDNNAFPSAGDYSNESVFIEVQPETNASISAQPKVLISE